MHRRKREPYDWEVLAIEESGNQQGLVVMRGPTRARAHFSKGCELDSPESCSNPLRSLPPASAAQQSNAAHSRSSSSQHASNAAVPRLERGGTPRELFERWRR